MRHTIADKRAAEQRPGGKPPLDCPGHPYRGLVTNRPASVPPLAGWRQYKPRAGCEKVMKELDADFALPKLGLEESGSTEAARSLTIPSHNLTQLFQHHLGRLDRVTSATRRFRLFTTGGRSETGGDDDSAGSGRPARTGLAAAATGEDDQPDVQLQCSGADAGIE